MRRLSAPLGPSLRVGCAVLCLVASGLWFGTAATPRQVTFRAGVDLVAVDAQVIDRDGRPIGDLDTKNFEVWINGQPRKVVSADRITYPMQVPRSVVPTPMDEPSVDLRTDVPKITGRIIVIAIDESSFATSAMPAVLQTVKRFLATVPAEDVVGLYAYPFGPARLELTHYHSQVALALNRIQGLRENYHSGDFSLSPGEAIDLASNDTSAYNEVFQRECSVLVANQCVVVDSNCGYRLKAEANAYVGYIESVSMASYTGLRDLLQGLSAISGPKTVMLLSAGFITSDRTGGRPDLSSLMATAGRYAAAADATLFAMHMDSSFQEASMADFSHPSCGQMHSVGMGSQAREEQLLGYGLERAASVAGGEYLHILAGNGDSFFQRVLTETSAYYLLGVEPQAVDRDGRVHFIRVQTVGVKGATLRARTQVTIPVGDRSR